MCMFHPSCSEAHHLSLVAAEGSIIQDSHTRGSTVECQRAGRLRRWVIYTGSWGYPAQVESSWVHERAETLSH